MDKKHFSETWAAQAGDVSDLSLEEMRLSHRVAAALNEVKDDLVCQVSVSGLARISVAAVRAAKEVWEEQNPGVSPEFVD